MENYYRQELAPTRKMADEVVRSDQIWDMLFGLNTRMNGCVKYGSLPIS